MKKITWGFLFSLVGVFTSLAQVQIGSGNNTGQSIPFHTSKGYSYTQSIYLNSEINASGTISSIQWYFDGSSPLGNNQDLVIYIGTTTKSSFAGSIDWIALSNLTEVYTGGIATNSSPGWKTITLTTPFVYDGVNNLVVAVDENTAGSDASIYKFRTFETSDSRSISYANNNTNPNPESPPITGGTSNLSAFNYLPNIIFGGLDQTCATPLNIAFTSVNDSSVIVNWENQGSTTPAEGYEIYLSQSNTTPTVGTAPAFSVASGQTSFTLTDLESSSTYYFWLRAKCSTTEKSSFSELKKFNTTTVPVTTFFESFQEITTPNLPLGWTKIVRGPSLASTAGVKSSVTLVNNSTQSVMIAGGTSTASDDVILVSPYVSNVADANNRLKFYAKGSGVLQIGTLSTNDENAVFTNVEEVALTTTTALYQVNFDYAISADHFIGIRLITNNFSLNGYIDDIKWEAIPTCPDVTQILVPEVTSTTAKINWSSTIGGETAWDIAIAPSTTLAAEGLTFFTSDEAGEYNATNLVANTEYRVWVRSVCGTEKGAWIGSIVFKTDCDEVNQFVENFDTTPNSSLPSCWSKILRGDDLATAADIRTRNVNANSGLMSLQLLASSSTGDFDVIAVSPKLSNVSSGTQRLKFFAKGAGVLQIGTVDYATNDGQFTFLSTVNTTAAYEEYVIDFSAYSGSDTHFGIRLVSGAIANSVYIDDVVWEPLPLCPDVTLIEVNNVSSNSATINWEENLAEGSWNIAIGSAIDTDPSSLPFFTSTTQGTYEATDLITSTTYNVWVRSSCGSENGAWIGPVSFTTSCTGVDTINESFDAAIAPALTDCWTKIIRGASVSASASVITFGYNDANSAPNTVKLFNANSSGDYDIMLISPLMNENVLNGSRVKFYAKSLTSDGSMDVVTMNSNTQTASYSVVTTIELTNNMTEYIVNLDGASSSDSYIGFRLNATSGYKTIHVDDVTIELLPSCIDVSDVTVNDITETTANLEWLNNEIESSWDIAVGPVSATDPSILPIISSPNNTLVLSELTASTYYKVWVRSVCSTGNGAWVGPLKFSTSCNPATTIDENFETTSSPDLPICWTGYLGVGATSDSGIFTSAGGFQSSSNVTIYASNSPANSDVILITPLLSNIEAANHTLTFEAAGSNNLIVGTLNSNNSDIVFTPFETITLTEDMDDKTIDFSNYTGTDTYIGFKIVTGNSAASVQYITIDNVVWGPNLSNGSVNLVASALYPNPVQDVLNITNSDELQSVTIYNLMGQQVLSATTNLSTIDMSHLTSGAYLVKLSSDNATKALKVIKN